MLEKTKIQVQEDAWGPSSRRVILLEADTVNRLATERLLQREEYWTLATDDLRVVLQLVSVSAADLVLVDLGSPALDPVPLDQRRRSDVAFRGTPPSLPEGYAVLCPLQLDPSCARFPLVTLKANGNGRLVPCRFGVVDCLPRSSKAPDLLEGLDSVYRDVVRPARERDAQTADGDAPAHGGRLPAATGPDPARAEADTQPFQSTPEPLRTALVVDPDPGYRRFVRESLARYGFSVYEAASGAEGLRQATARRPWVVLTEVNLPDQSGIEFCQRVRKHSLLRRTPVVFLSGWDDCEARYRALKSGADDFLSKPTSVRELLIRMELLLKRFSELEPGGDQGLGLRGSVDLVGAPAVLQICHLNQLSGVLVVQRGSQTVRIAFRHGDIVAASGPDRHGEDVVYDFIAWPQGRFEFDPGAVVEGRHFDVDFNALLLEGCRRLDERRRPGGPGPTTPTPLPQF